MSQLLSRDKKAVVILLCMLFSLALHAQNSITLSNEGRKNWKAANALLEVASSTDELIYVIQQFEMVTKSDPDYADTYYNLGKLYAKVGNEKGESYFDKAQSYYEKYKSLHPEDSELINDEIYVLNVLKEKYINGPHRFEGKWGYEYSKVWFIDIKYDGSAYQLTFQTPPESIEVLNSTTWIAVFVRQEDLRDELRAKGLNRYYDDCDSSADHGFPTFGKYYYNSWKNEDYYQISLSGKVPKVKLFKQHCLYYLNGALTYSETLTDEVYFTDDFLFRKN